MFIVDKYHFVQCHCRVLYNMNAEGNKPDDTSKEDVEVEKLKYVLYDVEDVPSPPVCFLFGLQVRFLLLIYYINDN